MLKTIRIAFYSVLFLFLLDVFNLFQTKIEILNASMYYGILILPIPLLLVELKAKKKLFSKLLRIAIPIITIIGLIYLNPLQILFNSGTWKTQTVKLINTNKENHKVEFQMKDSGALGYAKRHAEVYYLTAYFYVVLSENYDQRNPNGTDWKRVDEPINEIELKY